MALKDLIKFQFKRVNPFQGLVLDADTWRDEQDYHRNQQRLHTLAFHGTGIVEGLEVKASQPPDLSLIISPGMAIDPEGNVIVVSQSQHYSLVSRDKGQVYLIIQYREIPTAAPSEGEQPTRILEAYRIREVSHLPNEPYLELARINLDPSQKNIRNAQSSSSPMVNEINLRFRQSAKAALSDVSEIALHPPPPAEIAPQEKVILGHMALGKASHDLHNRGLLKLAHQVGFQTKYQAAVEECALDETVTRCTLLYITGKSPFTIDTKEQAILASLIQSGGTIFAEGCAEEQSSGAREFGLAFNRLAEQMGEKLEVVQRGHPLLDCHNVFSTAPAGAQSEGLLMAAGQIIYSSYDYGCAWSGGYSNNPLSRDIIRDAFEMGLNIVTYATMTKKQGAHNV
jgi:hypothetical protein